MQLSVWAFFKEQWSTAQPVVTADLAGKTVVVLGANTGLGFEASKHFATMNPGRLILACRNQSKGQAAVEKLKADTGYAKAELWLVDLADFASVKNFTDRFVQDGGRLDIIVENAAVGPGVTYGATKDGWETSLQVANLSTPLVALLLLPIMLKTAIEHNTTPRIVVVSSNVHYWTTLTKEVLESSAILETLGSEKYCTSKNMTERYHVTKLLNVFFFRALNERLAPTTPIVVDAVCPGYCYSELRRELSGVSAAVDWLTEKCLAFSTERGSRQLVYAALAHQDRPETLRGEYISISAVREVGDFVLSPEGAKAQDHIWDEMVEILSKVDPRVRDIVAKHLVSPA
ncbi:hypothetical protein B0H15DRAFT_839693 [Mycena belliarum]|uniref:NAD(P)-binding protein n=1 Tax=Mycena belliarum TaxID=1033014 RepID=A0AAD6U4W1_9AGAR|nr:hypothetical protein B0H15DRAFT_839693 [Mycena belliae]